MERFCTGIDIDKKTFKVCLIHQLADHSKKIKASRTFNNTKLGFKEFDKWLGKHLKDFESFESYVMEATGTYHERLAHHLKDQGKQVHITLALRSKRYLQSLGLRSKTDKIDAKGLAMMGCEQKLEDWKPGTKSLVELRSLTRQIENFQVHKTSLTNQLEALSHAAIAHKSAKASLKKVIKQMESEIKKLEKLVEITVMQDDLLRHKYDHFSTLKGVGLMTFAVVIAETQGFELFRNQKQLTSYTGYDVLESQSGQRAGKTRISKKGNTHIRRILHMSSLSVVTRKVGPFYSLYERVYKRTGIKMKGYVAVQRKLLMTLYTCWKKDEAFNSGFVNIQTSSIKESKLLFQSDPKGSITKTATTNAVAALDEHPCTLSPEVLFQSYQT